MSELTSAKAYVLGTLGPGDGYLSREDYILGLKANDEDFVEKFGKCLDEVYGKSPKYTPLSDGRMQAEIYLKKAFYDVLNYGELIEFKEKHERVPEAVKKSPPEAKSAYLRAFYDSQGSPAKRKIIAGKSNRTLLQETKELLFDLEIDSSITSEKGESCKIQIYGRKNLERFGEKIGFTIGRKQKKLKNQTLAFKQKQVKNRRWEEGEIKFLKENYDRNPKKMANDLERTYASIVNKAVELGLTSTYKKWTEEDEEYLKDNYDHNPMEIAKELGRTVDSVRTKAYEMGLTKEK